MHYVNHIVPAAIVFIEFLLNRIPFKRRHLIVIIPVLIAYDVVNVAVSLVRGKPVYAPLDPHEVKSYAIASGLPIVVSVLFLVWEVVAQWKIDKYEFKERFKTPIEFEGMSEVEENGE